MSGGGADVRNRAMSREHNVRSVDCKVAMIIEDAMEALKTVSVSEQSLAISSSVVYLQEQNATESLGMVLTIII